MAQRDHRGMTTVLAPVFRLERLNLTVPTRVLFSMASLPQLALHALVHFFLLGRAVAWPSVAETQGNEVHHTTKYCQYCITFALPKQATGWVRTRPTAAGLQTHPIWALPQLPVAEAVSQPHSPRQSAHPAPLYGQCPARRAAFECRDRRALPCAMADVGLADKAQRLPRDLTQVEMRNLELARAQIARNLQMSYEIFPVLRERRRQLSGIVSGGEQQMLALRADVGPQDHVDRRALGRPRPGSRQAHDRKDQGAKRAPPNNLPRPAQGLAAPLSRRSFAASSPTDSLSFLSAARISIVGTA